jgi:hypothetical protein
MAAMSSKVPHTKRQSRATIPSSSIELLDRLPEWAKVLVYVIGVLQSGEVVADSLTSLYELKVNDTFVLRFNPKVPSRFYCSEIDSFYTDFRLAFWLFVGFAVAVIVAIMLLRR